MLGGVLIALWAAAPPSAVKLAAPDFSTLHVPPELARFCNEHLAEQLALRGVRVITAREMQALLGLERQKQLLGCTDASSNCMAELANALGTDGSLLGDLAKLGEKYQLNVKVVGPTGALLGVYASQVAREDDLPAELTRAAETLAPQLYQGLGRAPRAAPVEAIAGAAPSSHPYRRWAWAPAAAGAAFLAVGAVMYSNARGNDCVLVGSCGPAYVPDPRPYAQAGQLQQALAWTGFGLGAASLAVAGAVWFWPGGDEGARVAVSPTPGGAALTWSGAWR